MTERKFTPPTEFPAEYVTRDGRKAVIVARTLDEEYPFVGWWVEDGSNVSCSSSWTGDGKTFLEVMDYKEDLFDIVPAPQKQVHWCNDYEEEPVYWYPSREEADKGADLSRIAVIRREIVGDDVQYFAEKV